MADKGYARAPAAAASGATGAPLPPEEAEDQHQELRADLAGMFPGDKKHNGPKRRLQIMMVPGEALMIPFVRSRLKALDREGDLIFVPLPLGDVGFCYDGMPDQIINFLIELKKNTDLSSSIGGKGQHGNRWKEQFIRMVEKGMTGHNIMYMVYGNLMTGRHAVPFKSRVGAVVKRVMRDGVSLAMALEAEYIADMIVFMLYYLEHLEDKEFEERRYTYADALHASAKKSAVQDEHKMERMLNLVNGMSANRAKVITGFYPDLPSLIAAYATAPAPELLLEDIEVMNESGTMRRIGPALSKAVCDFFGGHAYAGTS